MARRETTDDLDAIMQALPPEICERLQRLANRTDLLEVVMDLGRQAQAPPTGEEDLLDREITDGDIAHVIDHIGVFGDDNRAGIERTSIGSAPSATRRQGRRADVPHRSRGVRDDRHHPRHHRVGAVDPHPRPVRASARRRCFARSPVLADDLGKRSWSSTRRTRSPATATSRIRRHRRRRGGCRSARRPSSTP